jgi:hypothetical protein
MIQIASNIRENYYCRSLVVICTIEWIKVCDEKSLKDRDLVGFDYHDNNRKKKLLIAKIHGKSAPNQGTM